MRRKCENCIHADKSYKQMPCLVCCKTTALDKFEPKKKEDDEDDDRK